MTSTRYPALTRAGLTNSYLHTNSTTHQFLFGAVAELLDNARDAAATKINIFPTKDPDVRGGFFLNFLDDGKGMDPTDVNNVVQFGKSFKRASGDHMIGQYGNGLKSGSMRIGNDFILFTKRREKMSSLMLSRTFHDKEDIESVICPMPVWSSTTRLAVFQEGGKERHKQEIDLMCRYSPFKSESALLKQFDKIEGECGTLIVIYNIKLLDSGEPELDIVSDRSDIRMAEMDPEDQSNLPERVSFKAYASILYLDPRMKIYVQNKKIRTKRLASTLCNPMMYKFSSNRFKKRSEDEVTKAEHEYNLAEERARELESTSRDLEKKYGNRAISKEDRMVLRKAQEKAKDARELAKQRRAECDFKRKSLKDRKSLDFFFGFNIENRRYFGMFIYNCSRLIRMYERVGPQLTGSELKHGGDRSSCAGIIGVVNVPYLVLEPTHNKQHFADNKEYRHMLKAMGDHLQCYRRDAKEVYRKGGIKPFWESFGYLSDDWNEPPSSEPRYVRQRAMKIPKVIQCDSCLKWRTLPFQMSTVGRELPEGWLCRMNPDKHHNNCKCAEEIQKIPEGEFRKEQKTKEQRQAELKEKMQKMQRELNKVSSPDKPSPASRRPERPESSRSRKPKPSFESEDDEEDDGGLFSKSTRSRLGLKSSREPSKRARDVTPTQPPPKPRSERRERKVRKMSIDSPEEGRRAAINNSRSDRGMRKKKVFAQYTEDYEEVEEDEEEVEAEHMPEPQVPEEVLEEEIVNEEVEEMQVEHKEADEDDVPVKQPRKKSSDTKQPEDHMLGKQVEVILDNKWRSARIVQTDRDEQGNYKTYKLKFDQHPQEFAILRPLLILPIYSITDYRLCEDRFDKIWDASKTDTIRFESDSSMNGAASGTSAESSSSTAATSAPKSCSKRKLGDKQVNGVDAPNMDNYHNVLGKLKTCLRYFLPPNWRVSKDDIQKLSLEEIVEFPMDEFFDQYEKGLRCLVSTFKSKADHQQGAAEQLKQEVHDTKQIIFDLLLLHDSGTPEMSFNDVVPYARHYLQSLPKREEGNN